MSKTATKKRKPQSRVCEACAGSGKLVCRHDASCDGCGCDCHAKPAPAVLSVPPKRTDRGPVAQLLALVAKLDPLAVDARVKELTRGGHRPSSMSDGPGGGETPLPVVTKRLYDGDRFIGEELKPGMWKAGDPTERVLGVADPTDRGTDADAKTIDREVRKAIAAVITALRSQDRLVARASEAARREPDPEPGCASCERHVLDDGRRYFSALGNPTRQGKDTVLCSWCYDFAHANGEQWPPIELISLRQRGTRITSKTLIDLGLIKPSDVVVGAKNRVITIVLPNEA